MLVESLVRLTKRNNPTSRISILVTSRGGCRTMAGCEYASPGQLDTSILIPRTELYMKGILIFTKHGAIVGDGSRAQQDWSSSWDSLSLVKNSTNSIFTKSCSSSSESRPCFPQHQQDAHLENILVLVQSLQTDHGGFYTRSR